MAVPQMSRLVEIRSIPSSNTDLYTHAAGETRALRLITLTSTSGVAVTVSLWKVPDGDSTADANRIFSGSVPAGDFIIIDFPTPGLLFEDAGEKLVSLATVDAVVNIEVTGFKETL